MGIDRAYSECVRLMGQGASAEDCLARYPQYASELAPMLAALASSGTPARLAMPPGARERIRRRVMAEWDRRRWPARARRRLSSARWSLAASLVLVVLVLGGVGVARASQEAAPGGPLYPVKQLQEEARLMVATSSQSKVAIYTGLVRERVNEIRKLTEKEDIQTASIAVSRLEDHLRKIDSLVSEARGQQVAPSQTFDSDLLESLEAAIQYPLSVEDTIQHTLASASDEAYPCVKGTLEAIQKGRQRVGQALDSLEQYLPQGYRMASTDSGFCSR